MDIKEMTADYVSARWEDIDRVYIAEKANRIIALAEEVALSARAYAYNGTDYAYRELLEDINRIDDFARMVAGTMESRRDKSENEF